MTMAMVSGVTAAKNVTSTHGDTILNVLPAVEENKYDYEDDNQELRTISHANRKSLHEDERPLKMDEKHWVIIDIGGERFKAEKDIFLSFPHTRLGKLMNASSVEEILQYCEEFTPGDPPEFFFDRNPETFPGI